MPMSNVRFQLLCSAEDPQVPARVLGIFAARSLLPDRYVSVHVADMVHIDVRVRLGAGDPIDPRHLARVLCRICTVRHLRLTAGGRRLAFEVEAMP